MGETQNWSEILSHYGRIRYVMACFAKLIRYQLILNLQMKLFALIHLKLSRCSKQEVRNLENAFEYMQLQFEKQNDIVHFGI